MSDATKISAKDVKTLRDMTGAGMMDCKRALTETEGDLEKAVDLLRAKGAAKAAKRAEKSANEGVIGHYVHFDNKTAVIVEVNCETDFVANTDDFKGLARDLAIHIASTAPLAISSDEIDADVIARERAVYLEQAKEEGKPENIAEKIVEGRLQSRSWETEDGQKRTAIEISADRVQSLERRGEGGSPAFAGGGESQGQSQGPSQDAGMSGEDLPF